MSVSSDMRFNLHVKNVEKYTEESILKALEVIGLKAETYAKAKCPVDTGLLRNSIAHALAGEVPSIGASNMGTSKKARTYHANAIRKDGRPVEMVESVDKKGKKKQELPKGTYTGHTPKKKGEYRVYVGTNVEYAPYVEMGHIDARSGRHIKAQPYIHPAFEEHMNEYQEILKEYLQEISEEE